MRGWTTAQSRSRKTPPRASKASAAQIGSYHVHVFVSVSDEHRALHGHTVPPSFWRPLASMVPNPALTRSHYRQCVPNVYKGVLGIDPDEE
ncbi:hypothetical protein JCM10213v2_008866 [Rhodosporidiobolus nylandii]